MNILLVFPVFPEKFHPTFIHTYWVEKFSQYFLPLLEANPPIELYAVLGSHVAQYWEERHPGLFKSLKRVSVIDSRKLYQGSEASHFFKSAHDNFNGTLPPAIERKIIQQLETDFKEGASLPNIDLALLFFTKAPYLSRLFNKEPKYAYFSEGGITRAPFPVSWKFDPIGYAEKSMASYLAEQKIPQPLDPDQIDFLENYKSDFLRPILENNPFRGTIDELRKSFDRLVLLPLQVSGRCSFDCLAPFEDQVDYMYYVLNQAPSDTCILITEHPAYPIITRGILEMLSQRHPNAFYHPDFLRTENSSMYLLPLVDGVINVSSSIGWLALLYHKPMCVLGRSEFAAFAETTDLATFFKNMECSQTYDPVLHYLITKVWIPEDKLMDGQFLTAWLRDYCLQNPLDLIQNTDYTQTLKNTVRPKTPNLRRRNTAALISNPMQPLVLEKSLTLPLLFQLVCYGAGRLKLRVDAVLVKLRRFIQKRF